MPNPMYLLSTIIAGDLKKTLAACAMMTLDSISNYQTANNDAIIENLEESWKLDKDERNTIVDTHKAIISYLVNVANKNENIGDFDLLSQAEVENYVKHAKLTNNYQKRQFLETNQDDYKYYGPYWGLLAKTYYELGEYEDCINAINEYEKIRAKIFKVDHEFAEVLPCVIISLENVYKNDPKKLKKEEVKYLQLLEENVEKDNWNARYFISQMYISLSALTKNNDYLKKAYEITKNDLNTTTIEQETWIANYLKPVDESISKLLTKSELKKRKAQIKKEKELKSRQFIPYHEGFYQNYLLYSDLSEKLDIPEKEKETMRQIYKFALSVYEESIYLFSGYDDEFYDKTKSINSNLTELEIKDIYAIYNYRLAFDDKLITTSIEKDKLLEEIINNYLKEDFYYLPKSEKYFSVTRYNRNFTVTFPLCILKGKETALTFGIYHYDDNGEIITDYLEVFGPAKIKVNNFGNLRQLTSFNNSPVFFGICKFDYTFPKNTLEFDDNLTYYICCIPTTSEKIQDLFFMDYEFNPSTNEIELDGLKYLEKYDPLSDENE